MVTAVHRTIMVVDVVGFGGRTNDEQVAVRSGLYQALKRAFGRAGIAWRRVRREDRGDGVFLLIPPQVPKATLAEVLPGALVSEIVDHNDGSRPTEGIRLRMALHAGEVAYDAHGVAAVSINHAFRILEAPAFKSALAESAGVLGLVVSAWFFDEVVRQGPGELAAGFRPIDVLVKETAATAWISMPDAPYRPDPALLARPAAGGPRHLIGAIPRKADCYQQRQVPEAAETVLTGMGGTGKTQLAAALARRAWAAGSVDVLVWATAGTRESVIGAYAEAAFRLGLSSDPVAAEQGALRFLGWAQTGGGRWLVVLDDVQDLSQLRGLWPVPSDTGRVVATTRSRGAALAGRQIADVGLFTAAEARTYLKAKVGDRGTPEEVDALARDLGRLPLALAQAAAYIVNDDLDIARYRDLLTRSRLADALPEQEDLPDDHAEIVTALWELSVSRAQQTRPRGLARPLLGLTSVLDPHGIPAEVLVSEPARTYLGGAAAPDVDQALRALHRFNLIDHDRQAPHHEVRVHALVQRSIREALPESGRAELAGAAADALVAVWPETERIEISSAFRANSTAVRAVTGPTLHEWNGRVHPLLFRAAASLGEAGQAEAALAEFSELGAAATRLYGPDHPDALAARSGAARWRGKAGDPEGAVAALRRLLEVHLRLSGPDHPDTLATCGNLARWLGETGDMKGAIALVEQVLDQYLRLHGPDHRDTLAMRSHLAWWRGRKGDVHGATGAFADLLADRLRVLGPDHVDTLATRSHLARWLSTAGSPTAIAAFENLLADFTRVLGPEHYDTLATRGHLARCRGEAGDATRAVADLTALLADFERLLGPGHPNTLAVRTSLAHWSLLT